MGKLFKNFSKKDILEIVLCIALIAFQVWLDLKLPDYMSEITRLIQTEGTKVSDILVPGGYMLACAFGSLISAIIVGFFASGISANFSTVVLNLLAILNNVSPPLTMYVFIYCLVDTDLDGPLFILGIFKISPGYTRFASEISFKLTSSSTVVWNFNAIADNVSPIFTTYVL